MTRSELPFSSAGASRRGYARENNEDCYGIAGEWTGQKDVVNKGYLHVVADGMGGHAAGQEASHLAVRRVLEEYYADPSTDILQSLRDAISRANAEVWEAASSDRELAGMGTTLVAAVVKGSRLYLANVGDSRAYLARAGEIRQLTRDHSWVAEQVKAGVLRLEEARQHPFRNVITRSVGAQPAVKVDVFLEELRHGDRVLLCTDGVSAVLAGRELADLVTSASSAREGVTAIMDQIGASQGNDDHTALIIALPGDLATLRSCPPAE
ncbi:MAG: protein phosphatase 2C domain-containing protein [Anaerolineae bacterium]|nr:protein phosphatase 2C domain-containing protein [Anaerolineae bacterium]